MTLQEKKDFVKEFFNQNKQFVHTQVCSSLGIGKRAIYVLRRTKHQAVREAWVERLYKFTQKHNERTNK